MHLPTVERRTPQGVERMEFDGVVLLYMQNLSIVDLPGLAAHGVDHALHRVRAALRKSGRDFAYWCVPSDRQDVLEALRRRGLVQNTRPPFEERETALV